MALTAKQRIFVNEYVKSRNVTKAGEACGFSKKSAASQGSRLLKNAKVKAAVEAKLQKIEDKAELSAASVLAEIRKLAFVDNTQAYAPDGSLLPFEDMPEDVRKSIVGAETVELFAGRGSARRHIGHARKIKSADKVRALEMLAKHFKLLTDVTQLQNPDGSAVAFIALPANGSEAPGLPSPAAPTEPGKDGAADN